MYETRAIVGRQMGGCSLVTGRFLVGNHNLRLKPRTNRAQAFFARLRIMPIMFAVRRTLTRARRTLERRRSAPNARLLAL